MDYKRAEEIAAASLADLAARKHDRGIEEDSPDAAGGCVKKIRVQEPPPVIAAAPVAPVARPPPPQENVENLKPYPYFYYKDFSKQSDPDSLTPLTPPGRVPNFPAKMHAILSRPDLADVVCWMPHGRSWKVLKPREFEIRVIPTYFEHAKFSSFIRQANGWGFRRISTGRDRNSYYHPLFLRSLPHLCKEMKRPGVSKKTAADPDHEPDLYKISKEFPVPLKEVDDEILLQCTLRGGPKARMPIYSGVLSTSTSSCNLFASNVKMPPAESKKAAAASITAPVAPELTPRDQEALMSFQAALGGGVQAKPVTAASSDSYALPQVLAAPPAAVPAPLPNLPATAPGAAKVSALSAANQLAFGGPAVAAGPNSLVAALQASQAASQFAAGFAAAAALSHQQFQSMLQTMKDSQTPKAPFSASTPHKP